jgi:hypothetical protein
MAIILRYLKNHILVLVVVVVVISGFIGFLVINNMFEKYRPYISSSYMLSTFSEDYIEENRGNYIIEIPETFEMLYILIAISELGLNDTNLINKQSEYYHAVLDHFLPFRDHPAVLAVTSSLEHRSTASLGTIFAFEFDDDEMKHNGQHLAEWHFSSFSDYIDLLEDFSKVTGFRAFYKENSSYYQRIKQEYEESVPLNQMWMWLEKNFTQKHDIYRIVSSPLIGGSHYTHNFLDKNSDINEIVAFAPIITIQTENDSSRELEVLLLSRFVFTELNHNYVNPTTDRILNLRKVVRAFSNREFWYQGEGYDNPSFIFNEYMTWALFSLYVYDNYDEELFSNINELTVKTMVENRKFIRFEKFNNELLNLFINKKNNTRISELYTDILNYSAKIANE